MDVWAGVLQWVTGGKCQCVVCARVGIGKRVRVRRGGHADFNTKMQRLRHTSHGVTMAAKSASYAGESISNN